METPTCRKVVERNWKVGDKITVRKVRGSCGMPSLKWASESYKVNTKTCL